MKPIRRYAYLFAAITLLASATIISCDSRESTYPQAEAGSIDLNSLDFSLGLVPLDGQWEFYWMKILPPSSFSGKTLFVPDGYISVPGAWNGTSVGKEILDGKGYATYRLRVAAKFKGLMGLDIPGMATAYRLWVNGELVSSNGTVAVSPRESVPQYLHRAVYFYTDGNPFEIVVHISNFDHRKGGMWQSISIGDAASVQKKWQRITSIQLFLAGSLLIIALYHFIFFFFRKEESFILYFAILCLLIALRTGFSQSGIIAQTIPDLPWWLTSRIEYLTALAAPSIFILFLYKVLATEVSDRIFTLLRSVAVWVGIAACFIVLVTPVTVFSYLVAPFGIYFVFCALLCLWIMFRAISSQKSGAVPLFIMFCVLLTAISSDFFYNTHIINTGDLSAFGVLLFVAVQSIFVSLRYSVAFHDVELLSKQLVANNSMIQKLSNQIDQKNLEMSQRLYTDRLT